MSCTPKRSAKVARIKRLAKTHQGSGIIYASTRKAVEQVTSELRALGLAVSAYHAGLSDSARVKAQEEFMAGRTQMIVATNAFGMGIDKPDIRFVAHYQDARFDRGLLSGDRARRTRWPAFVLCFAVQLRRQKHPRFLHRRVLPDPRARSEHLQCPGLNRPQAYRTFSGGNCQACRRSQRNGRSVGALPARTRRDTSPARRRLSATDRQTNLRRGKEAWLEPRPALVGPRASRPHLPVVESPAAEVPPAARAASSCLTVFQQPAFASTPADVTRRAALERRKLREIIEFCYTEILLSRAHTGLLRRSTSRAPMRHLRKLLATLAGADPADQR